MGGNPIPTFTAGQPAAVVTRVQTSGRAVLSAWIDWNQDGDFGDSGEQVIDGVNLSSLDWNWTITPPATALPGTTYARFRVTQGAAHSTNSNSPTGVAGVGEVEDYQVTVNPAVDYGDAPDSYGTLNASNSASNVIGNYYLGFARPDAESDGQPTPGADGDDLNNTPDDEDGVLFVVGGTPVDPSLSPVVVTPGASQSVLVVAFGGDGVSGTPDSMLSAWIGWNRDGDFLDPGEAVLVNQPADGATGGVANPYTFTVPADAVLGATYARFRLTVGGSGSTNSGSPTGAAGVGEVSDYRIEIQGLDFGDAPTGGILVPPHQRHPA